MIDPWAVIPQVSFPGRLFCKAGALAALKGLRGRCAVLVTGAARVKATGQIDRAVDYLQGAGFMVSVGPSVSQEPSADDVQRWAREVASHQPDWIVGLGGGSVLDAAKGLWIWYEHPSIALAEIEKPHTLPPLRAKARLALVPTTSGSGAECSSLVTFSEPTGKRVIVSRELLPDLAILDPQLTCSMPPEVTAYTGMDALTHAQEAYVSTLAHPFVRALAVAAMQRLLVYLPRVYQRGDDVVAREHVQVAAALAGMAQSAVSTGLTHALAHTVGPRYHIPHGLLNALLLLPVTALNLSDQTRPLYAALAQEVGAGSIEELLDREQRLLESLGLRGALQTHVPQEVFGALRWDIAQRALADVCARTNPRRLSAEEVANWLQSLAGDHG